MHVSNSALGFPDGLRWQNTGERRVLPETMPFLGVGAEDLANRIDRSIQDRSPLGVAPKQGGTSRILAGPMAEICTSHLQGLARLAQAHRHHLRQFEANRVVDSVRHGSIRRVLPARCQRDAGACGAGAAGSESLPYLEGTGSGDPAYRGTLWAGWYDVSPVPSPGLC